MHIRLRIPPDFDDGRRRPEEKAGSSKSATGTHAGVIEIRAHHTKRFGDTVTSSPRIGEAGERPRRGIRSDTKKVEFEMTFHAK